MFILLVLKFCIDFCIEFIVSNGKILLWLFEWNTESVELWKNFTRYSIDAMQTQLDRLWVKAQYDKDSFEIHTIDNNYKGLIVHGLNYCRQDLSKKPWVIYWRHL